MIPRVQIEVEREPIPVHSISPRNVPDEDWRHVDKAGHGHFWEGKGLPTLEWVVTGHVWAGDDIDGEMVEVGEHRCRLCAEVVEPGRRLEYPPAFIPGYATVIVTIGSDKYELSETQYEKALHEWKKILEKIGNA